MISQMEKNQIICGDCLTVMRDMQDECIDLTVTSPPYDNLRTYKGYIFEFEGIAKELYRVTKQGGVVVWVVGDATIKGSETGTSFRQALFFKSLGFNLHDTMIYAKNGAAYPAGKNSNRYSGIFEFMFIFNKGRQCTANLIKDKTNRWAGQSTFGASSNRQKDGVLRKSGKRIIGDFGYRDNIWKINNGKGFGNDSIAFKHPAPFPDQLANDHIISWSNPGDIVLDPMCGSGTTCKMAKINNRNYIGIDISEEYCKISRDRINKLEENWVLNAQ